MLEMDPRGPPAERCRAVFTSASWSTWIVLGRGRPEALVALFARNFGTGFALTGSGIRKPCKKNSSIEIDNHVFASFKLGIQTFIGGIVWIYI